MRIGIQVSIRGSIDLAADRAEALGCETVQIFSCNPRAWKARPLDSVAAARLKRKLDQFDVHPLVVHVTYLPNLASPDPKLHRKSVRRTIQEVRRAERRGADFFVLHLGFHKGAGINAGVANVAKAVNTLIEKAEPATMLLLENSAGSRGSIGANFEQIGRIIERIGDRSKVGLCFDTAHGFAAGYDLRTKADVDRTVREIDRYVGIERLHVVHANDTMAELGSGRDRHEHIGKGSIGPRGMRAVISHTGLRHLPFILETPVRKKGDDAANVRALKRLRKMEALGAGRKRRPSA